MSRHQKWIVAVSAITFSIFSSAALALSPCSGPCFYPSITVPSTAPATLSRAKSDGLKSGWFVGLGIAQPWYSNTQENIIGLALYPNLPPDIYEPASLQNNLLYDAMAGYQFSFHRKMLPAYRLGLLFEGGGAAQVSGSYDHLSLRESPHTYQGSILTQTLLVNNQLDLVDYHHFVPYLEAGLGIAEHQLQDYKVVAPAGSPDIPISMGNGSANALAWLAGGGLGYYLNIGKQNLRFNLGCHYLNQGMVPSGDIVDSLGSMQEHLEQNVSQMELLFNASYVF